MLELLTDTRQYQVMENLNRQRKLSTKQEKKGLIYKITVAVIAAISCLSSRSQVIAGDMPTTMVAPPTSRPSPLIEGMWVWQPEYITNVDEQDKMLNFCRRQGLNRLLVQVPWVPGSAQIVHPTAQEDKDIGLGAIHPKINYAEQFARLIAEAAKRHIAVEALDGAPDMGDKIHWAETLATEDAIINFNNTLPEGARFVGIHWDIEPYSQSGWKHQAPREVIETENLQLLTDARKKLTHTKSNLTLAVDIPMWYDEMLSPQLNCIISFNGETKNFHKHIQDITDYVGIMSYRQHGVGNSNSCVAKCANEMAYAESIGKFVCPAFETTNTVDEPTITFYGLSAERLQKERHSVEDFFKDRPGFGGMFLHCYPAVSAILEPESPTK